MAFEIIQALCSTGHAPQTGHEEHFCQIWLVAAFELMRFLSSMPHYLPNFGPSICLVRAVTFSRTCSTRLRWLLVCMCCLPFALCCLSPLLALPRCQLFVSLANKAGSFKTALSRVRLALFSRRKDLQICPGASILNLRLLR